mgnify:CR=1 FL=1
MEQYVIKGGNPLVGEVEIGGAKNAALAILAAAIMTDETVTYLVKDYKNGGKYIEQTIKGTEFLRMFLMHVLPKGFVRIRHYGLLSCRNKKEKMTHCRKLLNGIQYISKLRGKTCAEKLMILYKKDICKCEACGGNLLSLSLRGHYMLT